MADEGLVLAARARLRQQALSSAQHAEGHLQVVGVGEWRPKSTRPSWNTDPRLSEGDTQPSLHEPGPPVRKTEGACSGRRAPDGRQWRELFVSRLASNP